MSAPSPAKRAPRKAAARPRKTAAAAAVVLDLDSLSKSKAFPDLTLPAVPFTFLLDGVTYELRDPRDSDWKLALELASNPFLLMRTSLVGADDPIDDPTDLEIECARERLGVVSEDAAAMAELVADGQVNRDPAPEPTVVVPALIDRFTAADLPTWKLNALFENWHRHYKIDLTSSKGILTALLGAGE